MGDQGEHKSGPEEDEEEIDELQYKYLKDAILFAIDVSKSMMTTPPRPEGKKADADSPVSAALKCACALMQQRIISNPKDMMGVVLFGTKESKSAKDYDQYDHMYLLNDVCVPEASDVRRLQDLTEDPQEFKKLISPSEERPSMPDMLFFANQVLGQRAPNFASKRLFIVTDDDSPHEDSKAGRLMALNRARDLYEVDIMIELFPIAKPGEEFNRAKFYNDIIYNTKPTHPDAPAPLTAETKVSRSGDGINLLTSLLSSISSKQIPKRAQFSNVPLELGPDLRISVKGYVMFKRQEIAKSCYIWLGSNKPQFAKSVTTKISDHEGGEVDKSQIRKAYRFGGTQITFTPEELSKLKYFGDPIIRIIGFKPITNSTLPVWANTNRSTFIYPSEEGFVGSTRVFSALHQKLLKDNKMALAWHISRKNAAPVLVAMYPGAEDLDPETQEQLLPPGFWLISLPFADDIRENPETQYVPATEDLIDKTRTIVKQLQLPKGRYNPAKYPNPQLQHHYKTLQAMALEITDDLGTLAEDKTTPKLRQIHKRTGQDVLEWKEQLQQDHRKWQRENVGQFSVAKRPASSKGPGGEGSKKVKVEDGGHGMSDSDMRGAYKKGTLGKMTVVDLKGWMHTKALDTTGKKADLVERVESWFETQGQ